jgi:hypothetical protein
MSELVNAHNRRSVLKRGLALAAGAVGLSVAGKDARAATRLDTGRGPLRFYGVDWRIAAPGRAPGTAIPLGEHAAVYGELLDARQKPLGQFYGSRLAIQSHAGGRSRADASVEVHTFVLPEGTIVGMGTSVLGRATFAIVGGTGAYAGATGSYVAHQRLRELGGDGTADFVLTLSL